MRFILTICRLSAGNFSGQQGVSLWIFRTIFMIRGCRRQFSWSPSGIWERNQRSKTNFSRRCPARFDGSISKPAVRRDRKPVNDTPKKTGCDNAPHIVAGLCARDAEFAHITAETWRRDLPWGRLVANGNMTCRRREELDLSRRHLGKSWVKEGSKMFKPQPRESTHYGPTART